MTSQLDKLKSVFKSNDSDTGGSNRPNNYYPFWNIPDGSQSIIRFLPDANQDNPMGFLVEKQMHVLTINGENKSVPCLKMYGEDCPICKVSSSFYKADDKVNGKKYWKKKQHLAQVLVVEDALPITDDNPTSQVGSVKIVALGYQIFNIIKDAFESGELDEIPYAYVGGTDFIIKKTRQGDFPSYSLSKFSRKSTDLTEDEIAMVQDNLIDLSTLLPQHPGTERVEAMLEAALSGGSYTQQTSFGNSNTSTTGLTQANIIDKIASASASTDAPESSTSKPTVSETVDDYTDEADKILQQIRARQANKTA